MKKLSKFIIYTFIFVNISFATECEFSNLTDSSVFDQREEVYDKMNNPGVRVAWDGMKKMNSVYLAGTVDKVINEFQDDFCNQLLTDDFRKKHQNVKVEIKKMDFKGYYITCTPQEDCSVRNLEESIKQIKKPKFPKTDKIAKEVDFNFVTSQAENYKEGYIRARVSGAYPEYDGKRPLNVFLQEKFKEAVKSAGIEKDLTGKKVNSEIKEKVVKNLNLFRADKEGEMDQGFKKLVDILDILEVPYASSSDFDGEINEILDSKGSAKGLSVAKASSGDDLLLFVKRGDDIESIVGVDIRGLGTLNMFSRFEEYVNTGGLTKKLSLNDVFDMSENSIKTADKKMKKSMDTYNMILQKTIKFASLDEKSLSIEEANRIAYDIYNNLRKDDPSLMSVRAGNMDVCTKDSKCIKDGVTTILNSVKDLEKVGVEDHFGESCIGVEYWTRKRKAKSIMSTGKSD